MTWYENDVQQLEARAATLPYAPQTIFYGSSSIRLWEDLYETFKAFQPVNLGFGGSTLEACVFFFERIMQPYDPVRLVVYAGDNDLGDGRSAEDLHKSFKRLLFHVHGRFPGIHFSYISIKPSVARRDLIEKMRKANQLIREELEKAGSNHFYVDVFHRMLDEQGNPMPQLFDSDGLHLSREGYLIWNEVLLAHLSPDFKIT